VWAIPARELQKPIGEMKFARWSVGIAGGLLAALWIFVAVGSRTPVLRNALVDVIRDQLDADVELQSFKVDTFPLVRVTGSGLKLRLHGQAEARPLIEVASFEVQSGIWGLLQRPRRFRSVTLDGLKISIPPRSGHDRESGKAAATEIQEGPVVIDHVVAHAAELLLIPKRADKEPKRFEIYDLRLESVGFNRSMPYKARLTNPVPKGLIDASGSFGPWRAVEPGDTPLTGRYTFKDADLDTIKGIAGTLSSEGEFSGKLAEIDVRGKTSTPNFSVDVGGRAVPLDTQFHAVVDGTDGDTYLKQVDAKFLDTTLTASGAITGQRGVKGRTIKLDVHMPDGKIDDVLRMAVKSSSPVMSGALALDTTLLIPPGPEKVADRLQLDGRFAIKEARFTNPAVHAKLVTLSRRSQGKDDDDPSSRVLSNMRGDFSLKDGVVKFKRLTFEVPGAAVKLAGDYGLRSEQLNFAGTLAMQATISQAVGGGVKGALLKAIDPLFKKNGHGAVIPITIHGSREKPEFGLDVKKSLGIGP
jgi:AsmA-like C-terminal region